MVGHLPWAGYGAEQVLHGAGYLGLPHDLQLRHVDEEVSLQQHLGHLEFDVTAVHGGSLRDGGVLGEVVEFDLLLLRQLRVSESQEGQLGPHRRGIGLRDLDLNILPVGFSNPVYEPCNDPGVGGVSRGGVPVVTEVGLDGHQAYGPLDLEVDELQRLCEAIPDLVR